MVYTISGVKSKRFLPSPAVSAHLRRDCYRWEPLAKQITAVFPSLQGQETTLYRLMLFQFRLDGIIGPANFLLPNTERKFTASLCKALSRLCRNAPGPGVASEMGATEALDQIKEVLIREGLIVEEAVGIAAEVKNDAADELRPRCGNARVFDLLDKVAQRSARINNGKFVETSRTIRKSALAILQLILDKGYGPGIMNELFSLVEYWGGFLEALEGNTAAISKRNGEKKVAFVLEKTGALLRAAERDGKLTAEEIVFPPELASLSPETRQALLGNLLSRGELKLDYISLSSAHLAGGKRPLVALHGRTYDLSQMPPVVLVPFISHVEVYLAKSGKLLGQFNYCYLPDIKVREIRLTDLKPAGEARGIIPVGGKNEVYIGGKYYGFTSKAGHITLSGCYVLALDGRPNLYGKTGDFLGTFAATHISSVEGGHANITDLMDGVEESRVNPQKRIRLGLVGYKVLRWGEENQYLRWVPASARAYYSLGIAQLFATDGTYLGSFKLTAPPERGTKYVDLQAVFRDAPRVRALKPRGKGVIGYEGTITSLYLEKGLRPSVVFSIFYEREGRIELFGPNDQLIGSFPFVRGERLNSIDVVNRLPQILPETETVITGNGEYGVFGRWGAVYQTGCPSRSLLLHWHPENKEMPYAETEGGRFILEHEPGSDAVNVAALLRPFAGLHRGGDKIFNSGLYVAVPGFYRSNGRFLARITDLLFAYFKHDSVGGKNLLQKILKADNISSDIRHLDMLLEAPPEELRGNTFDEIERPYKLMHQAGVRVRDLGPSLLTLGELSVAICFLRENSEDAFLRLLRSTGRSAIYMLADTRK
jgi:hypothetical protein